MSKRSPRAAALGMGRRFTYRNRERAWPRCGHARDSDSAPKRFISLFDTEIRAGLAFNHRNSLSRVIQNMAESHRAVMGNIPGIGLGRIREKLYFNKL